MERKWELTDGLQFMGLPHFDLPAREHEFYVRLYMLECIQV